ncbi:division/cell wall cluster transcriptional repressor MraZ [Aurantimonas sp. VKM B-3413]|uniref:division/cell wall cluster transcriptional repressor MraZ n=1 Tax=Aurantimonas sp. VKM B-3413 TaxID=2779401 RepID=UPI001E64576D|nr:division/cell wall cluster transcriptional repressor MraZ [Aurantimonas sp. VKM B-3413]MCB8837864.1 division/cell wall cluster transcriptional repressor MraZ [Aurantimonas sp. VKM B-3413]
MDRFLSNFVHNIDSKGRVSVPAAFRQVIAARGIRELFAMRSLTHPVMDVGGPELMERFEKEMDAEDPFAEAFQDLSIFAFGDGAYLKFDSEGRIQVTDFIRSHTGIRDRVAFVGAKDFFQLWEPDYFEAYRNEARSRLLAARSRARPTGTPPGSPE